MIESKKKNALHEHLLRPRRTLYIKKLNLKAVYYYTTQFLCSFMESILKEHFFYSMYTKKQFSACSVSSSLFLSLLIAHIRLFTELSLSGLQCKYPRPIITPTKCS